LSPAVRYFERLKRITPNVKRFQVAASFHHEFTSFEEFAPKILKIRDLGYKVSIREVVEPHTFDFCIDLVKKFEDIGLLCELKLRAHSGVDLRGKYPYTNYTPEMIEKLNQLRDSSKWVAEEQAWPYDYRLFKYDDTEQHLISEIDLFNDMAHTFKGWKCKAGVNHLGVRSNGDVVRCWDVRGPGITLGNVYKNNFVLPTEDLICPVTWCTSSTGIQTPKERIDEQERN
jgi:hypothetical protein